MRWSWCGERRPGIEAEGAHRVSSILEATSVTYTAAMLKQVHSLEQVVERERYYVHAREQNGRNRRPQAPASLGCAPTAHSSRTRSFPACLNSVTAPYEIARNHADRTDTGGVACPAGVASVPPRSILCLAPTTLIAIAIESREASLVTSDSVRLSYRVVGTGDETTQWIRRATLGWPFGYLNW